MIRRWLSGQSAAAIRLKERFHQLRDEAERSVLARAELRIPNVCPVCGARAPTAFTNPIGATWTVCAADGTIFADPVPTEEALELLQNDPSQAWPFLRGRQVADVRVAPNKAELVALEQMLRTALRPTTKLLDVGCGTGGLLLAARTRCDARGIELHAKAAEVARRQGLDVTQGRFETLTPFTRFDVVSLICVLEHCVQPRRMLEAAKRWVTPNGHVYVVTPNAGSVSLARLKERHSHLSSATNVSLFTQAGLRVLAEGSGFRVVEQALCGGRDLSLSDLVTSRVAPSVFRHRMSFYRPALHEAFGLAEQWVPDWIFPEGEPTMQRALLVAR